MILQVIPSVLFFVNEEKVEVREGENGKFEGPDIDAKSERKNSKGAAPGNPAGLRLPDP